MHPLVFTPLRHLTHQPLDAIRCVRYPHPLQGHLREGDHEPGVPLQEPCGLEVAPTPQLAGHPAKIFKGTVYPSPEPLPILRMLLSGIDEGKDGVLDRFSGFTSILQDHPLLPQGEEQVFQGVEDAVLPALGLYDVHQPRFSVGDEDVGLCPGPLLVDLEREQALAAGDEYVYVVHLLAGPGADLGGVSDDYLGLGGHLVGLQEP